MIDAYRAAIDGADAIIAERRLSAPPERPEEWWSEAGLSFPDLRALMHVMVETATHAGQLDAVRELIDGRQYVVL